MASKIISLLSRLAHDQSGNIMAITAAGMTAMLGAAGLGVDTVQWYLWKRQLQQSADAGALAGAYARSRGNTQVEPAVRREIDRNANTPVSIVRIATPPASGSYAGRSDAVEVQLTTQRALPFSSIFLERPPAIPARAVAARVAAGDHCVISLATTAIGVSLSGNAQVTLGCGVSANSVIDSAVDLERNTRLSAPLISAVGAIDAPAGTLDPGTEQLPYSVPQTDPLGPEGRNLQMPSAPTACSQTNYRINAGDPRAVLAPGRYCSGMTLGGVVTLNPGVYIVDGGTLRIGSQAVVTGTGVTIVLTGSSPGGVATVDVAGGASISLSAPTATQNPAYAGVLFFQDRRAVENTSVFAGGSLMNLNGILYFPNGNLRYSGGSTVSTQCLLISAHRVTFTGNTGAANNCPVQYRNGWANRVVRLVE